MQRVQGGGGSGSSNGSSGKGYGNSNSAATSGPQHSRAPRPPHITNVSQTATSQMRFYELPEPRTPPGGRNTLGKHRLRAELSRVNQEIQILQEELKAMDKTARASRSCKELVEFMETCADPLLPVATGPVPAEWDRWVRQPVEPNQCCSCFGSPLENH